MNVKEQMHIWLIKHNFIKQEPVSAICYKDLPINLPAPINFEFNRIKVMQSGGYGMVFAVRDLYETILKVICLSVCWLIETDGDDSFCQTLFSDKQMSFGDWVNALPSVLRKSSYAAAHPPVKNFLKKLSGFYNSSNIVNWRNNFIGHGLMSNPSDEEFFTDVDDKINKLIDFLRGTVIPSEISDVDYNNAMPFIFKEEGEFYIYESVDQSGKVFYTNQSTRRRIIRPEPYVEAKRKKYFSLINVMQNESPWEQEVYLSSEDEAVDGYYLTGFYKKPNYMSDWLNGCLQNYPCGIFLMQGARGTGKSSFALACDELNQHGDQKIKISSNGMTVSVRTYYCNRIVISNINDFGSYLSLIFNTLKVGGDIRDRRGVLPKVTNGLGYFLGFYREQYNKFSGGDREKLLLIIDGIDELTAKGWDILSMIPDESGLPEGVYILLTCRSDTAQIPPMVADFISRFDFTNRVDFDRRVENHIFMAKLIRDRMHMSKAEAEKISTVFDDRLTVLPLLLNLSGEEIDLIIKQQPKSYVSMEELARAYLMKLELCYGRDNYIEFIRFLLTVTEAREGLTLNEISMMTFGHNVTLREICFLKDATPLLQEFRSYRGNLYFISREEYRSMLRDTYKQYLLCLLDEWKTHIKGVEDLEGRNLSETYKDVMLYYAANMAELQHVCGVYKEPMPDDMDTYRIAMSMYHICHLTDLPDRVHRCKRALQGYATIEITLENMLNRGASDERIILLALESASDAIYFALELREMSYAADVINRMSRCIDKRSEIFYRNKPEIRFCLIRFYSCAMLRYCEVYDAQKAESYYRKAIEALDSADMDCADELKNRYRESRDTLVHNYLGVLRNQNPELTLVEAERYLKRIRQYNNSFSKANGQMLVAMCYKSAGKIEHSQSLLSETCEMMEKILEDRKMFWRDMLDPEEQLIYMSVYWRYVQAIDEMGKRNLSEVSFSELKIAIGILDNFIGCIIVASQSGYGHFDFVKINMMMTAALLRNMIAFKFENSMFQGIKMSGASVKNVDEYREEAFGIVKIIITTYENLDNANVAYNRIDAMFNQMNCACIYAGFNEKERAVKLLKEVIAKYIPENEQENMVYGILKNKLAEITIWG